MQFFFFHSLVALRRSHFQCGKCEGRRSQSSEARTPSLALPPRWARKGGLHLWCVTRLTFVCMLRYSEWDAVPIWVPGFFGIYSGMLYWAGFRILQYLQWNVILSWFPNSSIFTIERYTDLISEFFNIYILTWFPNFSIFTVERYTDLISKLFNIYNESLCQSFFWALRYFS